jgi:hypothetical protein
MKARNTGQRFGAACGAVASLLATSPAHAGNPACTSLPNPIYAIGGSNPQPILAKIGAALAGLTTPQTLIYQSSGGSCAGVSAVINGTGITGNGTYWNTAGTAQTCTFAVAQPADFAVSTTAATTCTGIPTPLPAGFGDFLGPIQSIDFIVPTGSSATSISAEAAYFLYGFGASTPNTYAVSPWTVPNNIITRNNQAGAAILLNLALGVPLATITASSATGFTLAANSAAVLTDVEAATPPSTGIGYVSSEVAEGAPANTIRVLAYQHFGQQCGWTPSSTPTALDKINVRNGHYVLWANVHLIAAVDGTGKPTDAAAQQFIGWLQDTVAPPTGIDIDALTIKAGATIDCAMEVKRTTDLGPLLPYAPAEPCGCYFDNVATGSTSCTSCTSNASCPVSAPNCRKGFCEVN